MPSNLITAIKKSDWNTIPNFLDSSNAVDEDNWTALHWSIYMKAPLDIFRQILQAHPESAHTPNKSGSTPLHFSVCTDGEEKINCLVKEAPETILHLSNFHFSPLHLALKRGRSPRVIQLLCDNVDLSKLSDKGKSYCEVYFVTWYGAVKYFLAHELQKCADRNDIQESIIGLADLADDQNECNKFRVKHIFSIAYILFQNCSAQSQKDFQLLPTLFHATSCPYNFLQLFLQIIPDQAQYISLKDLLSSPKKSIYNKIFICDECDMKSSTIFESSGDLLCQCCMEDIFGAIFINRNDDFEAFQTIFAIIKEYPAIVKL